MKRRCLVRVFLAVATMVWCACAFSSGAAGQQFAPLAEDPFDDVPPNAPGRPTGKVRSQKSPAAEDQDDDGAEDVAEGPAIDVEQATPEQARAMALFQMHKQQERLARPAASVIEALANASQPPEQPPEQPDLEVNESENAGFDVAAAMRDFQQFQQQTATGDWSGVKAYLAKFPPPIGAQVYSRLLGLLAGPQVVVLPQEIVPLADAAPMPLTPSQSNALGRLLKRSTARLGVPEALLSKIAAGSERLGGADPARRLAAARMFLAAGLLNRAREYLPLLKVALAEGDAGTLNLIARYQQLQYEASSDRVARDLAWQVTRAVLTKPDTNPAQRAAALRRALGLMPSLPADEVAGWLQDVFGRQPDLGMFLLAGVAEQLETVSQAAEVEARVNALRLANQVVGALFAARDDDLARWSMPLDMLLSDWLIEGERTFGTAQSRVNARYQPARRRTRNAYRAGAYPVASQNRASGSDDRVPPLPPETLLPLTPDEAWCRAASPELAARVRQLFAAFAARAADREKLVEGINRLDGADSSLLGELAGQYLGAWPRTLPSSDGQLATSYPDLSEAVPLTRARQARNLERFREMLKWLESLWLPLDPEVLVAAFDACFSPSEVYGEEELRESFGELDSIAPERAIQLAARMRVKLSGQWRDLDVQSASGTRRTDEELAAEVTRGYALAERLSEGAIAHPYLEHRVEPRLAAAALDFDRAEFLYGKNADLATYTRLRDRAFARYREAADLYAASLTAPGPKQASIEVYTQWFHAALGASDLAYLSRESKPDRDQIGEIAAALGRLPPESRESHLALFCESLTEAQQSLPPVLKPRYLREALRIVGEHPGGRLARQQLEFYDDLVREVRLHLTVDGGSEVGQRPFGAFLSIRSSVGLTPESGSFGHLLHNVALSTMAGEVNYRQQLETEIREKFAEGFEVEQIVFHDPNVQPRGFGRPGSIETPLAYLVVRAKQPAIDRLPVIQIDLSFYDGGGVVMLPITSQVEPIDARGDGEARPMRELQVKQVLDDRGDGPVNLQVSAVAKGLLPDFEAILDVSEDRLPGFRVKDVQDLGLEVVSLEATGTRVAPVCQRDWLLTLEPLAEVEARTFAFPPVKSPGAEVRYARYDDADVVDAAAVTPLQRPLFIGAARRWAAPIGLVCTLLLLAAAAIRFVLRRPRATSATHRYQQPARLTPFSALMLLKRISRDEGVQLSAEERASLAQIIEQLERDYFARQEPSPRLELQEALDRWLALTRNGRGSHVSAGQ